MIKQKLDELDCDTEDMHNIEGESSTQNQIANQDVYLGDTDKNLNKILNQQAYLKRMIDQDSHIQLLTISLDRVTLEIEGLRRSCINMNEEALKDRQELAQAQAKEVSTSYNLEKS